MVDRLSGMPPEITHEILKALDPLDIAAISRTCRTLQRFVSGDSLLFRDVYLNILDEPTEPFIPQKWDWTEQLKRFVKFRYILGDSEKYRTVQDKAAHLSSVQPFVSDLLATARPGKDSRNLKILSKYFETSRANDEGKWNQEAFLCRSSMFSRAVCTDPPHEHPPTTFQERQQSAKLHCLMGVPIELPARTHYHQTYPYAVSVVYDLRRYKDGTLWGPYQEDGQATVDWEKLEAVMVVLGHNLRMFVERTNSIFRNTWKEPWFGATPDSFVSESLLGLKQPAPPKEALDPYNVSGSWMRIVCFLDFHDLFAYNFASPDLPEEEPRPPLDIQEAIRLICMEIEVTKITPGEDGSKYPIVYFHGTSRSLHSSFDPNANSNIRGTVRMTKEGEVRWQSFSVYGGEERWKSEGIQIGGMRSQRGVFGHWFDKDHDEHGPAGPTAFWKYSDEIDDREKNSDDEEEDLDYQEVDGEEDTSDEETSLTILHTTALGYILGSNLQ